MSTMAWTCSDGPLVGFAAGFERNLVELGYRPGGVRMHLRLMRELNRWMAEVGLFVGDLNPRGSRSSWLRAGLAGNVGCPRWPARRRCSSI